MYRIELDGEEYLLEGAFGSTLHAALSTEIGRDCVPAVVRCSEGTVYWTRGTVLGGCDGLVLRSVPSDLDSQVPALPVESLLSGTAKA